MAYDSELKSARRTDALGTFSQSEYPTAIESPEKHDVLLEFLQKLLDTDKAMLSTRRTRFTDIDRAISTMRTLSEEELKAALENERKGKGPLVASNLPLMHSQLDDMASFFTEVFAPSTGSFFRLPLAEKDKSDALRDLARKMNQDARAGRYYHEIAGFAKNAVVYNACGFEVTWRADDSFAGGGNHIQNVDMYNLSWDPAITDYASISKTAPWAARFSRESLVVLHQKQREQEYFGVGRLNGESFASARMTRYMRPPHFTQRQAEASVSTASGLDAYFPVQQEVGAVSDSLVDVTNLYAWLDGAQHGLGDVAEYGLWHFTILDNKVIVQATRVESNEIPIYCMQLNTHTPDSERKSQAELLQPFQDFVSYGLGIYTKAMNSNVWGITVYDPMMVDLKDLEVGSVTARIPTLQPGRDVNSGIKRMSEKVDAGDIFPMINNVLGLMQSMFPAQAAPAQIAGMDRAVKSQVSAVMQGVKQKQRMQVRDLDSGVMVPVYLACFRNLQSASGLQIESLKEDEISTLLGTGLMQLNRESAEDAMRQLLFAIIQNPQSADKFDIERLIDYWASLSNVDVNLANMKKETADAAAQGGQSTLGGGAVLPGTA